MKTKKNKNTYFYFLFPFFLCLGTFSFAQDLDISGKLIFFNYFSQTLDPFFSGTAKLDITTNSSTVKSYLSAKYTESTETTEASLEKAYIKMRIPFYSDKTIRINIGKMPLSWGYGQIFNAGDLVFGALPTSDTTENIVSTIESLDTFRSDTEWMSHASIPIITNFCNFEPLAVILMEDTTSYFGGRFFFTPYLSQLETFEIGYLRDTDLLTDKVYIGFDGSYFVDYNVCISFTIGTKDSWIVSNGLQKIITLTNYKTGIKHSLTFKTEELWYPFTKDLLIFTFINFGITDNITTGFSYSYSYYSTNQELTNLLTLSFSLTPIKGLEIGLSSSISDIKEPTKNWITAFSGTFSF